jgi:membrane-bound inhibitor of C-type lysozyme
MSSISKTGIGLLAIGLSASSIGPVYAATHKAPSTVTCTDPSITIFGISASSQQTVTYICEDGAKFPVTYISTLDEQGFAVIPIDGKNRLFVTLPTGSGVRYGSGPYVWWNKGSEATLWNTQDTRHPPHGKCTSSAAK